MQPSWASTPFTGALHGIVCVAMVSLDHEAVEPAKLRIQDCSLLLDSQAYLLSSLRWLFEGLNWRASSLVKFEPHIDEIGAPVSRT